MNIRILLFALQGMLFSLVLSGQDYYHPNLDQSTAQESIWVDSVFNSMTFDQRLGQLMMIRAHSNLGSDHVAGVERLIRDHHVGGLCFFQGTPDKQVELLNRYQSLAKLPLMIAIDGEWGLNMRMKNVIRYPRQLMLGAIRDNDLIYDFGAEVAHQMQEVGVHVNFAPVVDVNNNAANPVIGTRSFGEDRLNVALKGVNYMRGMQNNGVVACAKHFPGHGDTDTDSHYDLPVITHPRDRLDSIEMYPFRVMIQQGVGSIMVAHLAVPAIEDRENVPTTLSPATVNGILREELDFHGLTFTDGLGMQGVTKHFGGGEVEAYALQAGNDILLLPESVAAAETAIQRFIEESKLTEAQINSKVKRVLRAKYRMGLSGYAPIDPAGILGRINRPEAYTLKERLVEKALTLVRNEGQLVPIGPLAERQIAAVAIGVEGQPFFQERLLDYAPVSLQQVSKNLSPTREAEVMRRLQDKDLVIVSVHGMNNSPGKNFGVSQTTIDFVRRLEEQHNVVLVVFGNPYALKYFDDANAVLAAYNDEELTQDKAAQALFGAFGLDGRLPVTASARSRFNSGVSTSQTFRLGYSTPESVGMNSDTLALYVDGIAQEAIDTRATPGCVVLVARHGKVVWHKAYGHHTYARRRPMRKDDIFDLASITKVAASTLSIMDLQQRDMLDVEQPIGKYLPELRRTNKSNLVIAEMMAHRAALKPWIPFYINTMTESGKRMPELYRSRPGGDYRIEVTKNLFLHQDYTDSIWHYIAASDLRGNKNYRYSDLGFYYMAKLVESTTGSPIDDYVQERFYQPLGLFNIGYNPLERFAVSRIPPTEVDRYWRQQTVQGYVHDMGAAMLGGVSGHAGLFGNAHDLCVLGQMLLQRGIYGNEVIIRPEVVRQFTQRYCDETRRAIGFDMKQLNPDRSQNVAAEASERVFGHLGFTGTCIWVDPQAELVYVFLSNRTYPSMDNNKLGRDNIRPRIQSGIYRAINERLPQRVVAPVEGSELPQEVKSAQ